MSQYDESLFSLHRSEGYIDLAQRLVECQYELTDRLAYFVCGRKPGKIFFLQMFHFEKHTLNNFLFENT